MKTPEIIVLQNDDSLEFQKRLILEALPSFESVLVIGRRSADQPDKVNFASCSMTPHELESALLNAMLVHQGFAMSVVNTASLYVGMMNEE